MTGPVDDYPVLDRGLDPDLRDIEAPTEDALEQSMPVKPGEVRSTPRVLFEVGDYDAIEQSRIVDLDDDY